MKEQFKSKLNKDTNIDKNNLTIYNVIVAESIPAKDQRMLRADEITLSQIQKFGKGKSIPVKFNHSYSSTAGDKIGQIDNFRIVDSKVIGDLSLYESANKSPNFSGLDTPITEYILDAASDSNTALMLSMSTNTSRYFDSKRLFEVFRKFSWELGFYWTSSDNKVYTGEVVFDIASIYSVDIVSEGALTNSLFSTEDEALVFFNTLQEDPRTMQIMQGVNQNSKKGFFKELKEEIKTIFNMNTETSAPNDTAPVLEAMSTQETPAVVTTDQDFEALRLENQSLRSQFEQLSQDFEAFKKAPSTEHLGEHGGSSLPSSEPEVPLYLKGSINERARQNFLNKQKINN